MLLIFFMLHLTFRFKFNYDKNNFEISNKIIDCYFKKLDADTGKHKYKKKCDDNNIFDGFNRNYKTIDNVLKKTQLKIYLKKTYEYNTNLQAFCSIYSP